MARIIDNIIALRIAYLLITPIENTDAFKLGLIDADGKTVRKAKTTEESNATSMLHRLCWNLKRIIGLVPGGSTRIGSLAATWLLMKEAYENDWTEEQLSEAALLKFNTLCESTNEIVDSLIDSILDEMNEDTPAANVAGAAVSTDIPMKKLSDMERRKKLKSIELP
jgi:hypothetical protein